MKHLALLSLACLASAAKQGGPCSPSWVPSFGSAPGIGSAVLALASFDDGGGPALYAGGGWFSPNGQVIQGVMKRTGTTWSRLGSGQMNGSVVALAVFDDGHGPALYAAGDFTNAGGTFASRIARWD